MKKSYFMAFLFCLSLSIFYAQQYPGGVAKPEIWYMPYPGDIENGYYRDMSGNNHNINDCGHHEKGLFNFNPSIQTENLCLEYVAPLEEKNNHNIFVVSDPIDNEKSYRHLSTRFNPQPSLIIDNALFLETQQGYASKMKANFSQHQNTHVHFYSWSNYDVERKYHSFGEQGETSFLIGPNYPFTELDGGIRFSGLMPEYISYDRQLTDNERNRVESYLALKYGITLDDSRSYKNSKNKVFWDKENNSLFKTNIFGIGRDNISGLQQLQAESAHNRDYLVAAAYEIKQTNEELLNESPGIPNDNYLVFGNTGQGGLSAPNEQNLRQLEKVWLAQMTGKALYDVPFLFKLDITQDFQSYLQEIENGDLVVWMLHDEYVNNSYVSDFDNGNVNYYKPFDFTNGSNGEVYAIYRGEAEEGVYFDRDQSFFDQYTFAVGPEVIIQVRFKDSLCKTACTQVIVEVIGGHPDDHVEIHGPVDSGLGIVEVDEANNKVTYVSEEKFCQTADEGAVYEVIYEGVENNYQTQYPFTVPLVDYTLDLGADKYLTTANPEYVLEAGDGIDDPHATYKWFYNDQPIYHTGSTLTADMPGTYCVTILTSDLACELSDCIVIKSKLAANITPVSGCYDDDYSLNITIQAGAAPYTTKVYNGTYNYVQQNTSSNFSINTIPEGSYTVLITDSVGATYQETVNFNNVQSNPFSFGPDQTLSSSQPSITLDGAAPFGNNTYTFQWYHNGILLSDTTSHLTVTTPGEYTVKAYHPDSGCSGEATISIDHKLDIVIEQSGDCEESSNTISGFIEYGLPDYHVSITGTEYVSGAPYTFNQTYAGDFTISGIPSGNYTFVLTDEYGGQYQQNIEFVNLSVNIYEQLETFMSDNCTYHIINNDKCEQNVPFIYGSGCTPNTVTLDASQQITSGQNISYEWFINDVSMGYTLPVLTFDTTDSSCYTGNNYPVENDCQGTPIFTVLITDNNTGCNISQSFSSRGLCPILPQQTSNSLGGEPVLNTRVYPNPSNQGATFYYDVSSDEYFDGVVELHDMNGKRIQTIEVSGKSSYTLPFTMLSSGVYFITTKTNGTLTTDRIIIE